MTNLAPLAQREDEWRLAGVLRKLCNSVRNASVF